MIHSSHCFPGTLSFVLDWWKSLTWMNFLANPMTVKILKWFSVHFTSAAQLCLTLRPQESQHARTPCPSPTPRVYSNSCPSSQWCHPTISSSVVPFSSCPQSLPACSNESTLHVRWPNYWSFSFSVSPTSEHPGLISFRMDWLDLLAVQGTLKSLLQHHSSKASILWRSTFFAVQLSHPCMTNGKHFIYKVETEVHG